MDNREARAEKIDMANEKWVESISAMSAEEAKKGLNEIIYSVLHDFSNYERKILIRAIAALSDRGYEQGYKDGQEAAYQLNDSQERELDCATGADASFAKEGDIVTIEKLNNGG